MLTIEVKIYNVGSVDLEVGLAATPRRRLARWSVPARPFDARDAS
jgi:hypothetical protein